MHSKLLSTNDASFEQDVLQAKLPVIVDVWAEWCGPCMAMMPIVEELAEAYQEQLAVIKLHGNQNPIQVQKYSIAGLPTLLFFKQGQLISRKTGMLSKSQLKEFIDLNLSDNE